MEYTIYEVRTRGKCKCGHTISFTEVEFYKEKLLLLKATDEWKCSSCYRGLYHDDYTLEMRVREQLYKYEGATRAQVSSVLYGLNRALADKRVTWVV